MGIFSRGNKTSKISKINWNILNSEEQINNILADSEQVSVLIFKHSTRCSISTMAKNRIERDWDISEEKIKTYYLDLISYRNVSNLISETLNVEHQSPQVIIVKNKKAIYNASHNSISVQSIKQNYEQ